MSHRKTKLIQERNLLLERKYILEQAPPPPPPASVPAPGAPPPTSPTTPPVGGKPSTSGTTETDKKISEEQVKKAQPCSDIPNKIDETKNEKKTIKIDGKDIIYFLGSKDKNVVFCSDYKKKME